MKAYYCEQRSPEWVALRLGRITGSGLQHVLRRKDDSKTRVKYMVELATERLTGRPSVGFSADHTDLGTAMEPYAIRAYEELTNRQVDVVGLVIHPTLDCFSVSPDGLVTGYNGGIEAKCPTTAIHNTYIESKRVPPNYRPQVEANIICCEAEWWDFVSYDPLSEGKNKLYVCRYTITDERRRFIEEAVKRFDEDVNETVERIKRRAA